MVKILCRGFVGLLLCVVISSVVSKGGAAAPDPLTDEGMLALLKVRKQQQARKIADSDVFANFRFSDEFEKTGITFTNSVVEDALKYFKAAHYDHGAGIAVADVDGDGLLDVYFVNQIGGNQLWRNTGNGKFENITRAAGVGLDDKVCSGGSFADIDNDGDPDLFVATVRMGNHLFENDGHGKFRDISEAAGVAHVGHSSGAVFVDVNNDGLLDLFVCNVGVYTSTERGLGGYYRALPDAFSGHIKPGRNERSLLYINQGNRRFREASAEMGLNDDGWSGDATFADVNHDGFPDLYVLSMQGDDLLFINEGGKKFAERTADYFPKTPWGAMGVKFFDFNQDGLLDLYVTDMHSDMTGLQTKVSKTNATSNFEEAKSEQWCSIEYSEAYLNDGSNNLFGNAFYRQRRDGKFDEVSDAIGAETFWPWGVTVADLNADGFPDAFVTAGMGFGFRYGPNSLLLNDGGKRFIPAELITGVEPRAGNRLRKTAFVLDCSGADRTHPLCRGQSGMLPVSEVLSSRSSVAFDLDGDGDLDLIVTDMDDRPQVLINNRSEKGHFSFVQVRLQGTTSNRDGLGALVKVTAGGRTWFQQHDGKSGYLSQSSMPMYFGLAGATEISEIQVEWPSGKKQTIKEPGINQTVSIIEPAQ